MQVEKKVDSPGIEPGTSPRPIAYANGALYP